MQIVINISEERFRDIQRIAEVQFESNYFKTAEQIIANGTPLPKGHGKTYADKCGLEDGKYKALEQESILDKIRAEIDRARFIDKDTRHCRNALASGLEVALDIIDKYRTESEE